MVVKVAFKNKQAKHVLYIDGNPIKFKSGEAVVDSEIAKKIKALKSEDYSFPEESPKESKSKSKK